MIDNFKIAAAGELFEFDQSEVGFDTGGVTVHQKANGSGGCYHRGLSVAIAVFFAQFNRQVPIFPGGPMQIARAGVGIDIVSGAPVHVHYVEHGDTVLLEARKGAFVGCHAGRRYVGLSTHDRSDGRANGPCSRTVVRQPLYHQESTQVGETEAERSVIVAVLRDHSGWI